MRENMKVITNKIRCNLCGQEIESTYRHEYVQCGCGSCAVDGGLEYLRRCFKEKGCYTELSVVEYEGVTMTASEYAEKRKQS